jgi:hypothetical protein
LFTCYYSKVVQHSSVTPFNLAKYYPLTDLVLEIFSMYCTVYSLLRGTSFNCMCSKIHRHSNKESIITVFISGCFPSRYKTASAPLLKKKGLNTDDVLCYRPISNLHTISKITEKLLMSRILVHLENSPNCNRFQSAYRRGHSMETALLCMLNDVYHNVRCTDREYHCHS